MTTKNNESRRAREEHTSTLDSLLWKAGLDSRFQVSVFLDQTRKYPTSLRRETTSSFDIHDAEQSGGASERDKMAANLRKFRSGALQNCVTRHATSSLCQNGHIFGHKHQGLTV